MLTLKCKCRKGKGIIKGSVLTIRVLSNNSIKIQARNRFEITANQSFRGNRLM